MARLVDDAAKIGAARLVIERDELAVSRDRRFIRSTAPSGPAAWTPCGMSTGARTRTACSAIPDAAAWCWAKAASGGRAGPASPHVVIV